MPDSTTRIPRRCLGFCLPMVDLGIYSRSHSHRHHSWWHDDLIDGVPPLHGGSRVPSNPVRLGSPPNNPGQVPKFGPRFSFFTSAHFRPRLLSLLASSLANENKQILGPATQLKSAPNLGSDLSHTKGLEATHIYFFCFQLLYILFNISRLFVPMNLKFIKRAIFKFERF